MEITADARQRLLDVAVKAFVDRGFEAVGVQQIVNSAGVTKPTLYHHFGSKKGLLETLCGQLEQALREQLGENLTYTGDLPEQLTQIIARIFAMAISRPREFRLLLLFWNAPLESAARETGSSVVDWVHQRVEELFVQAASQHGNMAGRSYQFAVTLLASIFAYGLLIVDGKVEYTAELPRQVMHQFSYGVYS